MFHNQIIVNNMAIGWNNLYKFLQEHWDALWIPFKNRHKLMILELKFPISILRMCDALQKNYKEQGVWVNDTYIGRFYNFFSNLNICEAQQILLNIISYDCCLWFWNIYAASKPISTLSNGEVVRLFDLFEIIKFTHPKAKLLQ